MTKCHLHIEYIHSKMGKDWQQHRKRAKRRKKVSRYKEGTHSWQRYLTRQGNRQTWRYESVRQPRRNYDEIRTSCQVWLRNTQTKSIAWKEAGNEQLFFRWNRQFLDSDCTTGIAFRRTESDCLLTSNGRCPDWAELTQEGSPRSCMLEYPQPDGGINRSQ